MLCKAIAVNGIHKIKEQLLHADMAEIRIELCQINAEEVKVIFSSHENLIATCRPELINDEDRKTLLKVAIESGAAFVDIEVESDVAFKAEIVEFAKKHDCTVIISYHNYVNTPSSEELVEVVQECKDSGAQLVKLATMVTEPQANARLLALYDTDFPMLAIGMGRLGIITRLAATKLGAPFTFVSGDEIDETAPGQIKESVMKKLLTDL